LVNEVTEIRSSYASTVRGVDKFVGLDIVNLKVYMQIFGYSLAIALEKSL